VIDILQNRKQARWVSLHISMSLSEHKAVGSLLKMRETFDYVYVLIDILGRDQPELTELAPLAL
jgi:hypothetical protein